MAGSPHDYDEDGNLKLPAYYGKSNLAMLLVFMLMAAMGASMRLAKQNYNRSTEGNWILAGALTSQSVQFKVRLNGNYGQRFLVSKEPIDEYQEGSPSYLMDAPLESLFTQPDPTQDFLLYGLEPSRRYYYARVAPTFDLLHQGSVQTAPPDNVRSNFTFVTTGSAFTGSQNPVFEEMAKENPLFFLKLGNLHYGDVSGELETRMKFLDQVMGSTTQEQLYTQAAFSYMWNDRDYLGENTLGDEPGREAALESYKFAIPSHQPPEAPLYQAYTIGTVRFIISDLRSEATADSIMSDTQREWLKTELSKAGDYDFVIWVTPSTWMGDVDLTQNDWTGRPVDRVEFSKFISALPSQNVLALSAGTEMFAFDDGSHTAQGNFSQGQTVMSFPLLMSGPVDRLGRVVEARYSEGCSAWLYERNHIYSVIEFKENEETLEPCLRIHSYRVTDVTGAKELLLEKEMCGTIFSPLNQDPESGSCQADRFSSNVELMATTAVGLLAANVILVFFVGDGFIGGIVMMIMTLLGVIATSATMRYLPSFSYNVDQYEAFVVALILNIQLGMEFLFLLCWAKFHHLIRPSDRKERDAAETGVKKAKNWVEPDVESNHQSVENAATYDVEDEDEENDQFPETNDVYMLPILANSPSSRRSMRSIGNFTLEKSSSVPSRLTEKPPLPEGISESTTEGRPNLSGAPHLFNKPKSVPSHLSEHPQSTETVLEQRSDGRPADQSSDLGNTYPSLPPQRSHASRNQTTAPRHEYSSSLARRPRPIEPTTNNYGRSVTKSQKKRDSSLLALVALIQENARRTSDSPRGRDPEPCQSGASRVSLGRGSTSPGDPMSDASFQSTFETEEDSMRNDGVADATFDPEADGLIENESYDDFETSSDNDTPSVTTSDETFDDEFNTQSRILLDPEDGSSADDTSVESEASDVESFLDRNNAIKNSRLEPEEFPISPEAESESSGAESVSEDESTTADTKGRLEPGEYLLQTENECSMAEFAIENEFSDESEESAVGSETSEDSTFETMLNAREAPPVLADEGGEDGLIESGEEADDDQSVDSLPTAFREERPRMQEPPDQLIDPRDLEEEDDQAEMVSDDSNESAKGSMSGEDPTIVSDGDVSKVIETVEAEAFTDESGSAVIDLESASDQTSSRNLDLELGAPMTTLADAATITPGKSDHDTDEATMSVDEESYMEEPTFKSEEMEITFTKSESADEDSAVADSEASFEEHMRRSLHPFPESPRRIAVDP
ncbi:hypothetical protein FisN_10Lh134 [Fistulifera solaris]|uniref:PhoD-like phosphatase metallophosphatase domain-containing protein n=1 Tax=Fistulifera solaris TaxID=1519565 RepID=A0A1Z5JTL3_FISSO|nr:hypothetical protein FisN_10Lh134 [Fistulifera solaris]|eukprot:GAX17279.1 hypothetical protein FisN_10Lh134 [Fistulifera solaris]